MWEIIFDMGPDPVTGRRRQRSRTVQGDRAAAETEAEVADPVLADDRKHTVESLVELWLQARMTQVRETTLVTYRQKLAHVVQAMGHRRLSKVTPGGRSALYGRPMTDGLSARSVVHVHRVTRRLFADASAGAICG